jgi:hypothetical protein
MTASARKNLCAAAALLGVLTFWCGLWMAARRYPSEYDWRFITISRLGYADRNPDGYRWAWGGLMLCGLGGLCWTAVLLRDWRRDGTGRRPVGIWALALGYVCMVGCASLPGGFPLLPRGHDFLAVTAFFGVCIGIVQMTFQVTERSLRQRTRSLLLSPRFYAGLLAGLPLSPILIAAVTQGYISHARPDLPWVGLEWRVLGAPVYLSFALWQWITCAVFSVYSVTLCLMTMMP